MSEAHLSHDEFFTRLINLFTSRKDKGHGSVCLTQKRLTTPDYKSAFKSAEDILWDTKLESSIPILVRATDGGDKEHRKEGRKVKFSTIVQPDDMESFFARYTEVCKGGMSALKKRDRTKRKKEKAKKRKAAAEGEKKT